MLSYPLQFGAGLRELYSMRYAGGATENADEVHSESEPEPRPDSVRSSMRDREHDVALDTSAHDVANQRRSAAAAAAEIPLSELFAKTSMLQSYDDAIRRQKAEEEKRELVAQQVTRERTLSATHESHKHTMAALSYIADDGDVCSNAGTVDGDSAQEEEEIQEETTPFQRFLHFIYNWGLYFTIAASSAAGLDKEVANKQEIYYNDTNAESK